MQIARILVEYASGKTCHTWYEAADQLLSVIGQYIGFELRPENLGL